jgi:hypothetical protein
MKISVHQLHGISNVKPGDIVDIDEDNARRYISLGYAEAVTKSEAPVENAVLDEDAETTSLDTPPDDDDDDDFEPLDEPEDSHKHVAKKAPAKRAPARTRS